MDDECFERNVDFGHGSRIVLVSQNIVPRSLGKSGFFRAVLSRMTLSIDIWATQAMFGPVSRCNVDKSKR